jgi:predicted 2-oxoglutarate/Fe(II)-dependent dioxygenase YbiX
MSFNPHHHAKLDPNFNDIISWVHFIDVPEQKCFRFTDTKGNTFVPDEQSTGDLICFPSWSWHEVIPNKTNHRRLIISGNISVTHYD